MANPRVVRALEEGLGLHRRGNLQAAIAAYGRVLAIDPGNAAALQYLAGAEVALGYPAQGVAHARRAAQLAPGDVGLVENVASVLLMAGDAAGAAAFCEQMVARHRRSVRLRYTHAVAHSRLRQFPKALAAFDAVLALDPNHVDALNERGATLAELLEFEAARLSVERAIRLAPKKAEAHFNLGRVFQSLMKPEAAHAALEKAIQLQPHYTEAIEVWAELMAGLSRQEEGLAACQAMIARDPNFEGGYAGAAILWISLKESAQAIAAADRATAIAPGKPTLHRTRADILKTLQRWGDAAAATERAYQLDPTLPQLTGQLVYAKLQAVDWQGIAPLIEACRHDPTLSSSFEALGYCDDVATLHAATTLRAKALKSMDDGFFTPASHPSRPKLSIAYVSGDFRDHPVSHLLVGLLENHDRSRFEITGIMLQPTDSTPVATRVCAAFDSIIDAEKMLDDEFVPVMRDRRLDIAVDLMGYTSSPRLTPYARRIAPVQATWLGYAGTVGTAGIDYLIADPTVVPEEHFPYYVEKIVHLPDTYIPTDNKRPISENSITRAEAGLPETGFVFCCFNQLFKILPAVFDIWMRILKRTPGSVLWLPRADAEAMNNLRREAQNRGIAPERLIFAERVATNADHLARLRLAGLSLDTLPYNAHTTTVDALWAGLPMLTWKGNAFAGRVAASLLQAIALPELVTNSAADYEECAVRLAGDPEQLGDLRRRLQANRLTRPLFDSQRFARHIEAAYETMWERFCQGLPPAPFAVPARP